MLDRAEILLSQAGADDFPNTLVVGAEGSGKTRLAEEFLLRRYGAIAADWRITHLHDADEDVMVSGVGYKLDMRIHRRSLIKIIQTLATSKNVATGHYNVFVICHFEEVGLIAQGSLRRIVERTKDTARFIVLHTGELSSVIAPLQSRFQIIIMPPRGSVQFTDLYERFKVPAYLPSALLPHVFEQLDTYVLNHHWNRIIEIRELLFAMVERGYNMKSLMRSYVHHVLNDSDAAPMLIKNNLITHIDELTEALGRIDSETVEKDIYQMEYALIQIKKWGRFK